MMNRYYKTAVLIPFAICLLSACAKRGDLQQQGGAVDTGRDEAMSGQGAGSGAQTTSPQTSTPWRAEPGSNTLAPVYFDFDRHFIRADQKTSLESNADILKKTGSSHITVEGNCDDRGTIEYNIALGQQRAEAIRGYYIRLGIPGYRINAISYGKERQVCSEATEECWQRNRRAETKF